LQQGNHSGLKNTTAPRATKNTNAIPTVAPTAALVVDFFEEELLLSAGGGGVEMTKPGGGGV
jgi:hypothetical protein